MHMVKAGVMEDIYAHNNHIAEHVREYLMKRNVYTINVMGAPGTGKTTSLEQLMKHMKSKYTSLKETLNPTSTRNGLEKKMLPPPRSIPSAPATWTPPWCTTRCTPWISEKEASFYRKRRKSRLPRGTEHRRKYQNAHRQRGRRQRQALQIPPGL